MEYINEFEGDDYIYTDRKKYYELNAQMLELKKEADAFEKDSTAWLTIHKKIYNLRKEQYKCLISSKWDDEE
jgi:hypothetical protein